MTKKILVMEDEYSILINLVYLLEAEGYEVISAQDGAAGINLAKQHLPDLIISDIMMPGVNGYQALEALRKDPATVGIQFIFLSAKSTPENMREGMQLGADDYICKPFNREELLGAVAARLQRHATLRASILTPISNELFSAASSIKNLITLQEMSQTLPHGVSFGEPTALDHSKIICGNFEIDFEEKTALVDGHKVKLLPKQLELLRYLVQNADKVVAHKDILRNVWGHKHEKETQYLHVYINQLRQKIEPDPANPRYILTERGFGYRFAEPTVTA